MKNASDAYNHLLGAIRDLIFEKKTARMNHEMEAFNAQIRDLITDIQMAMISVEENLSTDELQRLNIFLGLLQD